MVMSPTIRTIATTATVALAVSITITVMGQWKTLHGWPQISRPPQGEGPWKH